MSKFNPGDKVRVVNYPETDGDDVRNGQVGVVSVAFSAGLYPYEVTLPGRSIDAVFEEGELELVQDEETVVNDIATITISYGSTGIRIKDARGFEHFVTNRSDASEILFDLADATGPVRVVFE